MHRTSCIPARPVGRGNGPAHFAVRFALVSILVGVGVMTGSGCASLKSGPLVIYLEGAGWYSSAGGVEQGLRDGGYTGQFQRFTWSAFLGPAHDHLVNAKSRPIARRLARLIEDQRRSDPDSPIYVMGLSAGTSLILLALPMLPEGVQVDHVVLFSPSVSSEHDLLRVMRHVKGNLYATCSPHDGILATLPVNADGKGGAPAGRQGFKLLPSASAASRQSYGRVVNLPWQSSYLAFGWTGSHTSVTDRRFIREVIAPRIFSTERYPLDRSLLERTSGRPQGATW